jgi:hypothetical protein
MMVTPPGGGQLQTQDLGSKLEDIVIAARPHRTNGEIKILTEYEYINAGADEDYGRTNKVNHCIDTGDPRSFRQTPRRIPLAKQAQVKEVLYKMQRHGVIEESESPWPSPVVLDRKKNGELRFSLHYK